VSEIKFLVSMPTTRLWSGDSTSKFQGELPGYDCVQEWHFLQAWI